MSATPSTGADPFPQQDNAAKPEECCICFEPLCHYPVSGFFNGGKRKCAHFVHSACAEHLIPMRRLQCPMCRTEFDSTKELPDPLTDTQRWFDFIDVDGTKKLGKEEVLWALATTMDADPEQIRMRVDSEWPKWDKNKNNTIEYKELSHEAVQGMPSLLSYIQAHRRPRSSVPILDSAEKWFTYWDENKSSVLEFEEVFRALCLTFTIKPVADPGKLGIADLKDILAALWFEFDPDGSGTITRQEFCMIGGLWEMVQMNLR